MAGAGWCQAAPPRVRTEPDQAEVTDDRTVREHDSRGRKPTGCRGDLGSIEIPIAAGQAGRARRLSLPCALAAVLHGLFDPPVVLRDLPLALAVGRLRSHPDHVHRGEELFGYF